MPSPPRLGLSGSIEDGFRRRLDALPADTRRLLQLAAADPVGEPLLVWRAAERLGIEPEAATPAVDAGLFEIGAQVRFRHPLVRSAAYRSASPAERYALHAALAEATDAEIDPDRRAWHRAQAARRDPTRRSPRNWSARPPARRPAEASPRRRRSSSARRRSRPTPAERVRRLLAAARAKRDAGALEAALQLLTAAEAGPMSRVQAAEVEHLRGRIAFDQRRVGDAARLLVGAAKRLEPLDPGWRARRTWRRSARRSGPAIWTSPGALVEAAEAARAAPPAPDPPGAVDVVLDALALRLTEGYAAAAPALEHALETVLALQVPAGDLGRWLWLTGARATGLIALELWDADAWHELASRQVRVARDAGALVQLQFALNFFASSQLASGELTEVAVLVEEERVIAQAMGSPAVGYEEMLLAAWRGQESLASELIERMVQAASARGLGRMVDVATYAKAVLYNGIGRYEAAREAARAAFEHRDHVGSACSSSPSWPRRRREPAIRRSSRPRSSGCRNAHG